MKKLNERWVIGIDLDGTLLRGREYTTKDGITENHSVSPLTRDVLHAMHKEGHVVCIDTGRGWYGASNVYKSIGLPNPIINFAGAHIHNPMDDSFEEKITPVDLEAVKDLLNNDKYSSRIIGVSYDTPEGSYFNTKDLKVLKDALTKSKARHFLEDDEFDIDKIQLTAVNVMYQTNEKEIWTIIDDLEKKYGDRIHVVDWISKSASDYHVYGIEINSANAAKGKSVVDVANMLGIPTENTMGIGDSPNDKDLMVTPNIGVAVANARDEIKELADIVIDYTNEEEGVAKFLIERFNLDIEY